MGRGAFQLKKLECQHPAWRCAGSAPLKRGGAHKKAPRTPKISNTPPVHVWCRLAPEPNGAPASTATAASRCLGLGEGVGQGRPTTGGRGGLVVEGAGDQAVGAELLWARRPRGGGPEGRHSDQRLLGSFRRGVVVGGGGRHPLTCYWTFLSRTSGSGTVRRVDRGLDVLQVPWQTVHFLGTDVAELYQKWPFRGASNSSIYVFVAQCHRNFLASARINVDIGHGIRIWQ